MFDLLAAHFFGFADCTIIAQKFSITGALLNATLFATTRFVAVTISRTALMNFWALDGLVFLGGFGGFGGGF